MEALAAELLAGVAFVDTLDAVSEEAFRAMYGIEEDGVEVENYALYAGTGATAEEVAVMEAADEDGAKALEEAARGRIEAQKDGFENYNSGELAKLDAAVLVRKGRYVALCVSDDSAEAERIIEDYFK
ncbi:MAG: DUF4358 domain-containing protein [Clostridiales Family XIII bacterium]|nr:DUF4358 domain-containing protein [Clostridiales Family XIII bacterium]